MCVEQKATPKKQKKTHIFLISAFLLGLLSGYLNIPFLMGLATVVAQIFVNLLKLISIPIIFFSVASTITGMKNLQEAKFLGKKTISYTLLTTAISASIGLLLFLVINPANKHFSMQSAVVSESKAGYLDHLSQLVPSNIIQPFHESNVIAVLGLAILFGLSTLIIDTGNRNKGKPAYVSELFADICAVVMKITSWIVKGMPIGVWGFSALFVQELNHGLSVEGLVLYLACVVAANLTQGFVVLPAFLKFFKISPIKLMKDMFPAISMAFFTKSSVATLPMALKCAQENAGISSKVSNFTFPLCTTINMNACAAFILITVMFVTQSHGTTFSLPEMILWIGIATIAAIGNAGVPMGCYFLTSSLLVSMDFPLTILGIILPFYAMIDMLETALNIWSDSCVAAVVDKNSTQQQFGENNATVLNQS
jgi:Na+/H+-dicarboxylate symporter